jgi:hypothetical protein
VSCCKPNQDGTCQANGDQAGVCIPARILYGLADEMATRAETERHFCRAHQNQIGTIYDKLAAFFLRCGAYADEWDVDIDDLKPTAGGPEQPARTTDARWLAAQADLYASQHGRRESEVASMLRAASFLCAARGASLEDLQVVVESFGEGKP